MRSLVEFRNMGIKPFFQFIIFTALNILLYTNIFSSFLDFLPTRIEWIKEYALYICIACGVMAAIVSTSNARRNIPPLKELRDSGIISGIGLVLLISLYAVSFVFQPVSKISIADFESAGLTPGQVTQIQTMIEEKGFVTFEDIEHLALSPDQHLAMEKALTSSGFVNGKQVEVIAGAIARTEIASIATQTAVAKISQCYITPEKEIPQVGIRISPDINSEFIGLMKQGQQFYVIGHNGGRINQDRWWLVEIEIANEKEYGWVASWYVQEINEMECMQLEQAPGS